MLYMSCNTVITMWSLVVTMGICSTLMCMGPNVFRGPNCFMCSLHVLRTWCNHGIKAKHKGTFSLCRCGREGCPKCAFILHTCKFRTPVSITDIGKTMLRDVTTHELWGAVKETFPLRPPKHVLKNRADVDASLVTFQVGAIGTNWVDIMNERHAATMQDAKRANYDCVCGRPLCVQVVPGNGWYKAHCEQRRAHKGYICTGSKWVDSRGRKKMTMETVGVGVWGHA